MATQNNTAHSHYFGRYFSIVLVTFLFVLAGTANSADLRIAWDANSEPDLVGYRVFCGESSGDYTVSHEITSSDPNEPPPTTCEFTGLEEGRRYYFAAIALSDGGQSDYSQEISYTVPATPVDPQDIDDDGDGITENDGDCDDANPSIHPGADEVCGDGIDQDCNDSDPTCVVANTDSDGDGLTDSEELHTYHTDPNKADSDDDGLIDSDEVATYYTDPNIADMDGDGFSDGEEITNGFDPNDPNSNPGFNPAWNSASDIFSSV